MRKTLAQGFTLVELLIVIALLGVIATIVIAAINPLEQANRATDSGMKADASQIVSAIQRYYTTHNEFPWNTCTGVGCVPLVDDAETGLDWTSADAVGVGLCSTTACKTETAHGSLIEALELQSAFLSKSWVNPTTLTRANGLYVSKGTGSSASVFVCWVPKSNSNRQTLMSNGKMVDATAVIGTSGLPVVSTACDATSDTGWTDGTCSECVPE